MGLMPKLSLCTSKGMQKLTLYFLGLHDSIAKMELPVRCGSKLEVRVVVRFFAVRGKKLVEIYHLIRETYGYECQSIAKHWRKNQCVPTLKY